MAKLKTTNKMPPPRPKSKAKNVRHAPKAMARIRPILARTKASRAELDARCEGADMSDLDQLPVMVRRRLRTVRVELLAVPLVAIP